MGGDDDEAGLRGLDQRPPHPFGIVGVELGCRLVAIGRAFAEQHAGDRDTDPLAAREVLAAGSDRRVEPAGRRASSQKAELVCDGCDAGRIGSRHIPDEGFGKTPRRQ